MENIVIKICKREDYIKAWLFMYKNDKKTFNDPIYDGVNPMQNKTALKTEIDNWAAIAFDTSKKCEEFEYGTPVGIFSMVITKAKVIGKQFIVHKNYQGNGIGTALISALENKIYSCGYRWYYIGCSSMSARILRNKIKAEEFSSDEVHDLFKFNVDLDATNYLSRFKEINQKFKIIE